MVVVNFILQKKASFFNEFHYLKDFHLHKLFYTLKKWVVVIISLILIVAVIGVGSKIYMDKRALKIHLKILNQWSLKKVVIMK